MTIIFRGVQNSLRSPLRVLIAIFLLTLSTSLIISMLIAHDSITTAVAIQASSQTSMLHHAIIRSEGAIVAGIVMTTSLVMLTLITIIREQRHEIGVIKAIGGSTLAIIAQFIIEIAVLAITGLLAGLLLGSVISPQVTYFLSAYQETAVPLVLAGRVFFETIGFVFGATVAGSVLPAYLISRIRPIEATRPG